MQGAHRGGQAAKGYMTVKLKRTLCTCYLRCPPVVQVPPGCSRNFSGKWMCYSMNKIDKGPRMHTPDGNKDAGSSYCYGEEKDNAGKHNISRANDQGKEAEAG